MIKTLFVTLFGLAFAAFVVANWPAFTASTVLTLGVVSIAAPIGLLLLFVLTVVTIGFLAAMAVWQSRILRDARRHTQELAAQRALAQDAEASRYTSLTAALLEQRQHFEARVEVAEASLRAEIHDGVNSLAAMVAELDDRLHHEEGVGPATEELPPRGARH